MKFKKIDDKKFQCTLFQEDLENNDITIEDFLNNDVDKIRNILDNIMQEAQDEIGIQVDGGAVSMQLMPMPDHALCITVSFGADKMKQLLEDTTRQLKNAVDIDDEEVENDSQNEEKVYVFAFDLLSDIEDCCTEYGHTWGILNALYKDNSENIYYLCLQNNKAKQEKFDNLKTLCMEFGKLVSDKESRWAYINERFDVLIQRNAMNRILGYCGGKRRA